MRRAMRRLPRSRRGLRSRSSAFAAPGAADNSTARKGFGRSSRPGVAPARLSQTIAPAGAGGFPPTTFDLPNLLILATCRTRWAQSCATPVRHARQAPALSTPLRISSLWAVPVVQISAREQPAQARPVSLCTPHKESASNVQRRRKRLSLAVRAALISTGAPPRSCRLQRGKRADCGSSSEPAI